MSQSLADIILHIVFSTKDRYPYIQSDIENELFQYICGVCRNHDCPVIQINGMPDHVHVLLQLGRTISVSKIIAEMKSSSSCWIKKKRQKICRLCMARSFWSFFSLSIEY